MHYLIHFLFVIIFIYLIRGHTIYLILILNVNLILELHGIKDDNENKSIIKDMNIPSDKENKNKRLSFNDNGTVKTSTTNLHGKLKRDKRENCMYCEQNVTNFSRHLIRRHDNEIDVVKVMSLKKNSVERKYLLEKIRKGGKYFTTSIPFLIDLVTTYREKSF